MGRHFPCLFRFSFSFASLLVLFPSVVSTPLEANVVISLPTLPGVKALRILRAHLHLASLAF